MEACRRSAVLRCCGGGERFALRKDFYGAVHCIVELVDVGCRFAFVEQVGNDGRGDVAREEFARLLNLEITALESGLRCKVGKAFDKRVLADE